MGEPYRYSVSSLSLNTMNVFTTSTELKNWFAGGTPLTGTWLCVSDTINCGAVTLATMVPAIVYSLGQAPLLLLQSRQKTLEEP